MHYALLFCTQQQGGVWLHQIACGLIEQVVLWTLCCPIKLASVMVIQGVGGLS